MLRIITQPIVSPKITGDKSKPAFLKAGGGEEEGESLYPQTQNLLVPLY